MPGSFSRDEVERIARLARLALTDDEKDLFARQLGDILAYAEQIGAVDTAHVPPTTYVSGAATLREDRTQPSLSREEVLAAAPDADLAAGLFKVPRVLG